MYQQDGRAILGHKPGKISTAIKNEISRGLFASYPVHYYSRFIKVLQQLLPFCSVFRIFPSTECACRAVGEILGKEAFAEDIQDPLLSHADDDTYADNNPQMYLWRPFCSCNVTDADAIFPILPFPAKWGVVVVGFPRLNEKDVPKYFKKPVSPLVSPIALIGLEKAANMLKSILEEDTPEWENFSSDLWTQVGPYLIPNCSEDVYYQMYENLLKKDILISPDYPGPSIIPMEYTNGEIKAFRQQ